MFATQWFVSFIWDDAHFFKIVWVKIECDLRCEADAGSEYAFGVFVGISIFLKSNDQFSETTSNTRGCWRLIDLSLNA